MPDWLNGRNGHLIETFLFFVCMQLVFARVYLTLYRRRRDNFSFNSEILKQQAESKGILFGQACARLRDAHDAILELRTVLESGEQPIREEEYGDGTNVNRMSVRLHSGKTCTFTFTLSESEPFGRTDFEVFDSGGKGLYGQVIQDRSTLLFEEKLNARFARTSSEWLELVPIVVEQLTQEQKSWAQRLESLNTPTPDVWSYLDFVYFSTIVQTTVGFGDILPNSTTVRMVVTAQIVAGYALLMVVLNIVMAT